MKRRDLTERWGELFVVGHPSAPIGMGEHVRSVYRAMSVAGECPKIVDIYGPAENADRALIAGYSHDLRPDLGSGINIFCINGDEIPLAVEVLRKRNVFAAGSYSIIFPAWELERYPEEWAKNLELFNEVWAPSLFIRDSISKSVSIPVLHKSLACEIPAVALLSRRHFGIPDSPYAFFFSFDFLSYIERKNPFAVFEAFAKVIDARPAADVRLVIKVNNSSVRSEHAQAFKEFVSEYAERVTVIDRTLNDLEMKALMWSIDCFVSLHRSEGFGRGMSEAMVLGKPVIATAYSGNLDFCTDDNSFLVPAKMIPVKKGEYPHWEDQVWADPDVDAAAAYMIDLVDDPTAGLIRGAKARATMAAEFSFLARGFDYVERVNEIRKAEGAKPQRAGRRSAKPEAT